MQNVHHSTFCILHSAFIPSTPFNIHHSPFNISLLLPPAPPPPRRRLRLAFRSANAVREGLPLAELVDIATGGEGVELEQGQSVVEGLAVDEAKHGPPLVRRLEEAPQRLQRL